MAGWSRNLKTLELDLQKLEADIDKLLDEKIKIAARIWLTTVLEIVPTWSGASRATFEALAQAVGAVVTYGPIVSFEDRRPLGSVTGWGGLEKYPALHLFYYRTRLEYLIFNEANVARLGVAGVFKGLITPTPYKFFEKAELAFLNYAKTVKLPVVRVTSKAI